MSHIDRRRAEQARRDEADGRLIFAGWLCAILFQPVGLVIGGILISRDRLGHGIGMMALSLVLLASLVSTVG